MDLAQDAKFRWLILSVVLVGILQVKIYHFKFNRLYLGDQKFIHSTVAENTPYIHISSLTDSDWNGSGRFAYRAARTLAE